MSTNDPAGRHRAHEALAVPSRVRLLDVLRAGGRPMDVRELAAACDLHVSTVRFHLDVLTRAGLVRSHPAPPAGRGRPPLRYSPASHGSHPGGTRTSAPDGSEHGGYEMLAAVLAGHLADTPAERTRLAERAGREMAREQGFSALRVPDPTAEESVAQVSGLFTELGFEPEVTADGGGLQIRLHACPFRSVAAEHPEVVCALHLGLLRGALADLGAPVTATALRPFVEPHLCVAEIGPGEPVPPGNG